MGSSGEICLEELRKQVKQPTVGAHFANIGVDVTQVGKLFELLDQDMSGSISVEEFIMGCVKLKGEAKSLDIAILHSDIRIMLQGLLDMANSLDTCMIRLDHQIQTA